MPGPHPRALRSNLAFAVASGQSVTAWAKKHDIPVRTAYDWVRRPEFRAQVENFRRRAFDRAIGQMSRHMGAAVAEIVRQITEGSSDSVRLQAARAVVADFMVMSDYAEIEKRMNDLEKQFRERTGGAVGSP